MEVDNNQPEGSLCDEIEKWIVEYAVKHKLFAVLDEIAKLHPHVSHSLFGRLTTMRFCLLAFPRLALSSNIPEVKAALKYAQGLFRLWPDTVAIRHRTKVVLGLRIRIVVLAIEQELQLEEISSLLNSLFEFPDSQLERMHSSVADLSKEGVSSFIEDIETYILKPTQKRREQLLGIYSIVSPQNESFRKVIETYVLKYSDKLEAKLKEDSANLEEPLECKLEKVQTIFSILSGSKGEKLSLDAASLLRLLRAVHVDSSSNHSVLEPADSLLQMFCTAPEYC